MNDHLPECRHASHTHAPDPWCDCKILRACERRVLDAAQKAIEKRPWSRCVWQAYDERANCIAAIDALQSEQ